MAEAHLPLTSLQSLLGHCQVRSTQIYAHLSNTCLQTEYNHTIAQIFPPPIPKSLGKTTQQQRFPKPRQINWDQYAIGLPERFAEPLRAFCSQPSQATDPIQRTRNLLSCLSGFARWAVEHVSIANPAEITPRIWIAYAEDRRNAGIKTNTLNTTLHVLQAFLKFVRDRGHPICERMLEVRPLKTPERLPRDLTQAQLNGLLEHADSFDYAWILLMSHSGLRTCEIRNLSWSDIDLQHRTFRIEETKGLRSRVVFLSQPTINALQQLPKNSEHVFTYNGQSLSSRYCQSRLKTIGKKCGVQATPHPLRHTCATMLLNAGMSIFAVQVLLGHKYVDTTLRYARAYDATVAKDYQEAVLKIT